ncbi:MAG: hypothetical protein VYD28_05965, partial [SAR324 cluster bacterium]|nr:hypothetical protein [SAR324 cluster bacterium]
HSIQAIINIKNNMTVAIPTPISLSPSHNICQSKLRNENRLELIKSIRVRILNSAEIRLHENATLFYK